MRERHFENDGDVVDCWAIGESIVSDGRVTFTNVTRLLPLAIRRIVITFNESIGVVGFFIVDETPKRNWETHRENWNCRSSVDDVYKSTTVTTSSSAAGWACHDQDFIPLSLGWKSRRSLPKASLKARTSCVRATMSSCSTRWLSELLPSDETLAKETDREPDAEPTPLPRPVLPTTVVVVDVVVDVDEDVVVETADEEPLAAKDVDESITATELSSGDELFIKCGWIGGTCRQHFIKNEIFRISSKPIEFRRSND